MCDSRGVRLLFCSVALAAVIRIAPAFAQEFPLLEGHGRPEDVRRTFSDPAFKSCHSVECEGVRDVTEDFAEEVRLVHSQCVDNWHRPHCDELRLDVPAKSPGSGR
jgi:hypothetical protein